jgi:hypothetical protein
MASQSRIFISDTVQCLKIYSIYTFRRLDLLLVLFLRYSMQVPRRLRLGHKQLLNITSVIHYLLTNLHYHSVQSELLTASLKQYANTTSNLQYNIDVTTVIIPPMTRYPNRIFSFRFNYYTFIQISRLFKPFSKMNYFMSRGS